LGDSTKDFETLFDGTFHSRRRMIGGLATALASGALTTMARATVASPQAAQQSSALSAAQIPYPPADLPVGIRSRFVDNVNGLRMHVLEAGFEAKGRPCVVLLHGYPELGYSWRKVMLPIAAEGFHVIAPDRRGYGRTSGSDVRYDDPLDPFGTLNQVTDIVGLVSAFGYRSVAAVIGHDQGSPIAAWAALVRPDIFRSVALMSSPFAGPPALSFDTADATHPEAAPTTAVAVIEQMSRDLAALNPPRKYYQWYNMTRPANENFWHPPQGLHDFLRSYYNMKSADWKQNAPFPLKARTASEWAKLPRYYVMDLDKGMAETVAPEMPSAAAIAACKWLTENELKIYAREYGRTGFQAALNGYRVRWSDDDIAALRLFSGRTIDVPAIFLSGKSDWSVFQTPGDLEKMQKTSCTRMMGTYLIDGAGHWVQQEQAEEVIKILKQFLRASA
jgi:pimeloyl-ACP methyl ester carboxylesterase